ncbi:hypothetical protein BJY54_006951 [Streptomyces nodosus]|uniref:hypothetical protein n=1 Tax=Streptomyces nodosus TaxID=40318 RepID=UPI00123D1C5B|nr:hypothetical protein [Streptomyces nodosus]MBB4796247.1 hypothetical protein [Streptomyces nodosus]
MTSRVGDRQERSKVHRPALAASDETWDGLVTASRRARMTHGGVRMGNAVPWDGAVGGAVSGEEPGDRDCSLAWCVSSTFVHSRISDPLCRLQKSGCLGGTPPHRFGEPLFVGDRPADVSGNGDEGCPW